jgi:hypothetical protein
MQFFTSETLAPLGALVDFEMVDSLTAAPKADVKVHAFISVNGGPFVPSRCKVRPHHSDWLDWRHTHTLAILASEVAVGLVCVRLHADACRPLFLAGRWP